LSRVGEGWGHGGGCQGEVKFGLKKLLDIVAKAVCRPRCVFAISTGVTSARSEPAPDACPVVALGNFHLPNSGFIASAKL